ncbi:MAG: ABC-F family ATP-binding cassette domain-containing protein [Bacteroidales bacterium]|nr:ABC-F family ATP-binding cassette domain-containing protein [Bacteroidales bacterium]
MISINNLTVAYGGFTLLDAIDFHISDGEKIGLVGKNGAGKSTLMKIIMGLEKPDSGRLEMPRGQTIGYLPQIMEHHRGKSVIDEVKDSCPDAGPGQAEKILAGLGFLPVELSRPVETFSQGWNMRMELAKILLQKPSLLLLDEPTNHLDIESIEWLEDYLKAYRGAILVVSHDRKFLDNVTSRTVEIMLGHLYDYKVPYSSYVELRKERIAQQTAAYENQQKMIEKTEEFIRAFRYKPTKSNQVQSRIKSLARLERIEIDETDNATLRVKFPPASRTGDVVYKGSGLTVGYPSADGDGVKVVFSNADVEIRRGEKVAFVGRNGEGKTTLMRVIAGELEPISGESKVGHNVNLGYFAQNQEDVLDKTETVWSTVERVAPAEMRTKLRDLLAQFLFRGEDIDKRVSVLSGGERARLGMARMMLQSHNVLALDEPTNHMDIRSKDILKQALQAFDGTLIVVSHDRDFLDGLVDKLYEFRGGKVREHLGGVRDFLEKLKIDTLQELERSTPNAKAATQETPAIQEKPQGNVSFEQMKAKSKEEKKKRNRIAFLEAEIAKDEKRMKEIESVLASPKQGDDIIELTREYLELKRDLDAWTEEWGSLI